MDKSNWRKDILRTVRCYRNDCPLRRTYGSGPNIPIKEAMKCSRRLNKGCAGNEWLARNN